MASESYTKKRRTIWKRLLVAPLILALLFLISGMISLSNIGQLQADSDAVAHTHDVLAQLDNIVSLMKDAETGQRGFVLTGKESYLEPYDNSLRQINQNLFELELLLKSSQDQRARLLNLRSHIKAKFSELAETISLRRTQGEDAARQLVDSGRGKEEMDQIRSIGRSIEEFEIAHRDEQIANRDLAFKTSIASSIIMPLVGLALTAIVAVVAIRAANSRWHQDWLQSGQLGLSLELSGDQKVDQLSEAALKYIADYSEARAGAFYVREGARYRRAATFGVPAGGAPESIGPTDGLLGQAIRDRRSFIINDIPDGYLSFGSAFGSGKPKHLLITPCSGESGPNAIIELGYTLPVTPELVELSSSCANLIGTAIQAAKYRENLQKLLEETQLQAEELQTQGEELRVANEELEEQTRALRTAQGRLEQQQSELEQTNSQLEEQAQLLEAQRDDLAQATNTLEQRSTELERASRYKSDFLANMSHELRTPLNSSLILAKLLAENRGGNLTEEQVNYARTIEGSGNDLLSLINDILDLSKIEAGHMRIQPEKVLLGRIVEDLERTFRHIAEQKALDLHFDISPNVPDLVETDPQRLQQILKNLLSNALKFTERGEVSLKITSIGERISFAVRDSGIGISEDRQQLIFEAFRQADGNINRRYGGTGLGLSIARELVRLLGGEITLHSVPEQGSEFTVILPKIFNRTTALEAPEESRNFSTSATSLDLHPANRRALSKGQKFGQVVDDRQVLAADRRIILVIEDDEVFAKIIYDLSHELNFSCLISSSAEDGYSLARQYRPNAIVLDVALPDYSGITLLDRIKHDPRTRHIPVHMISAFDYGETAFALGAVGYLLKPVKREELVEAFRKIEQRLDQRVRRVLIVEDDPTQLDSMIKLISTSGAEVAGVGSAADCLKLLQNDTFDCMVLDLTLPDASGYTLLETLESEDSYSFPPVIVYTGREISAQDEELLRRYSKSIIIKGAKSPERLLDEVTLFLHQVISDLPPEQQKMIEVARSRDAALEGRRILIVEDDVRNIFALTSILEPRGAKIQIARNGKEALQAMTDSGVQVDLILMDIMMPEMDGLTATREIRKLERWSKVPIIALTAKAMKNDQEDCLQAGANDYMSKPLDVEKLLSLVRVWMPR